MAKFEKVSKFAKVDFKMPCRKTKNSAGYDMVVAEDTLVPSLFGVYQEMDERYFFGSVETLSLSSVANLMKNNILAPTLVSSGVKCKLADNEYLELSVRSSTPLKYGLIMANGVGIVDADYYNCKASEGEIFFQLYNLSPFDILLKKGDCICQGIIHTFDKVEDTEDVDQMEERTGGFSSTDSITESNDEYCEIENKTVVEDKPTLREAYDAFMDLLNKAPDEESKKFVNELITETMGSLLKGVLK